MGLEGKLGGEDFGKKWHRLEHAFVSAAGESAAGREEERQEATEKIQQCPGWWWGGAGPRTQRQGQQEHPTLL